MNIIDDVYHVKHKVPNKTKLPKLVAAMIQYRNIS